MKNLVTLILVCLLIANCKSGSDSGGSASSGSWASQEFIPDDINDLGSVAKAIIEADAHISERYYSPLDQGGNKIYSDLSTLRAIKAYVNARAKMVDVNGAYDIENNAPLDAYNDLIVNAGPATQGLSNRGMCIFMADVMEALTVPTRLIEISGNATTAFPSGNHCAVEISMNGYLMVIDPVLNMSYYSGPDINDSHPLGQFNGPLDADGVDAIVDYYRNVDSDDGILSVSPDGYLNASTGWRDTVDYDTYYHYYQGVVGNPNAQFLPATALEMFDDIYQSVSFTDYSSLNR